MAPRPHDLVLRDLRARARRARLPALRPELPRPLQLLLQRASARSTRGRSAACSRGPSLDEVLALPRGTSTSACSRCSLERGRRRAELLAVVELGLHHEQQHQELILTDVKHAARPRTRCARPTARSPSRRAAAAPPLRWSSASRRACARSATAGDGFAFDNEAPRHRVLRAPPSRSPSRLVTNGEYLAFIEDGGYARPELWLSDGWARLRRRAAGSAPLYWERDDGALVRRSRSAACAPLRPEEPVAPRQLLRGRRLRALGRRAAARPRRSGRSPPRGAPVDGQLRRERRACTPPPAPARRRRSRSSSATSGSGRAAPTRPTRATAPPPGALGEYNGKFMCNQLRAARRLLRDARVATCAPATATSSRPTARWQFSGIRLARDAK